MSWHVEWELLKHILLNTKKKKKHVNIRQAVSPSSFEGPTDQTLNYKINTWHSFFKLMILLHLKVSDWCLVKKEPKLHSLKSPRMTCGCQTGAGARWQCLGSADSDHRPPGAARPRGAVQRGSCTLQLPQHLPPGGPQRGLGSGNGWQAVGGAEGHRWGCGAVKEACRVQTMSCSCVLTLQQEGLRYYPAALTQLSDLNKKQNRLLFFNL